MNNTKSSQYYKAITQSTLWGAISAQILRRFLGYVSLGRALENLGYPEALCYSGVKGARIPAFRTNTSPYA
jgi:hypothetical protein